MILSAKGEKKFVDCSKNYNNFEKETGERKKNEQRFATQNKILF
jgi:hypothetical protein